jgi:hypothetical protein
MRFMPSKLAAMGPFTGLSSSELTLSGVEAKSLAKARTRSGPVRSAGWAGGEFSRPKPGGMSPSCVSEMWRECREWPASADGARSRFGSGGAESVRIPGRDADIDRDDRTEPPSSAKPTFGRGPVFWFP